MKNKEEIWIKIDTDHFLPLSFVKTITNYYFAKEWEKCYEM